MKEEKNQNQEKEIYNEGKNYSKYDAPDKIFTIRINRKSNRISFKFNNPKFSLETFINESVKTIYELDSLQYSNLNNECLHDFLEGTGLNLFDKSFPKILRYREKID